MPIKGIILIFVLTIIIALYYHEEIYAWLSSLEDDEDNTKDKNQEEEL